MVTYPRLGIFVTKLIYFENGNVLNSKITISALGYVTVFQKGGNVPHDKITNSMKNPDLGYVTTFLQKTVTYPRSEFPRLLLGTLPSFCNEW